MIVRGLWSRSRVSSHGIALELTVDRTADGGCGRLMRIAEPTRTEPGRDLDVTLRDEAAPA